MTHYQALEVEATATAEEIKAAWRRAQLRWHPDRCREQGAAAKFRSAATAYEVLADPDQRRRYDVEQLRVAVAEENLGVPAAEQLARQHFGRDLTERERRGVRWLSFAARLAGRR